MKKLEQHESSHSSTLIVARCSAEQLPFAGKLRERDNRLNASARALCARDAITCACCPFRGCLEETSRILGETDSQIRGETRSSESSQVGAEEKFCLLARTRARARARSSFQSFEVFQWSISSSASSATTRVTEMRDAWMDSLAIILGDWSWSLLPREIRYWWIQLSDPPTRSRYRGREHGWTRVPRAETRAGLAAEIRVPSTSFAECLRRVLRALGPMPSVSLDLLRCVIPDDPRVTINDQREIAISDRINDDTGESVSAYSRLRARARANTNTRVGIYSLTRVLAICACTHVYPTQSGKSSRIHALSCVRACADTVDPTRRHRRRHRHT